MNMISTYWTPVQLSITVAALSSIVVFILGIGLARLTVRRSKGIFMLLETFFMLPLVLPPSVIGFFLIILLGKNSWVGQGIEWLFGQSIIFTWWAAVIAATVVALPLMYQSCKTGFASVDREIEDAARIDGASEWYVFLRITIPLAARSIVTGYLLSFTRALGEFGATLMFAGNIPGKTQTIPTAIYVAIDSGNMTMAWMWVVTSVGISFFMLAALHLLNRKQ